MENILATYLSLDSVRLFLSHSPILRIFFSNIIYLFISIGYLAEYIYLTRQLKIIKDIPQYSQCLHSKNSNVKSALALSLILH